MDKSRSDDIAVERVVLTRDDHVEAVGTVVKWRGLTYVVDETDKHKAARPLEDAVVARALGPVLPEYGTGFTLPVGWAGVAVVWNEDPVWGDDVAYVCVRVFGGPALLLTAEQFDAAAVRAAKKPRTVASARRLLDTIGRRSSASEAAPAPATPSALELRVADLQDLACKVLAVLEDEPADQAVPIVVELLHEHLDAGDLTLDFGRLGTVAGAIGAQDEQADLLEALAVELELIDAGEPGQTRAIAEDLAVRGNASMVRTWAERLVAELNRALGSTEPPERWCSSCFVWTRRYDPAFKLHNDCGRLTHEAPPRPSDDGEDWTVPEPASSFHGTHPDAEDLP